MAIETNDELFELRCRAQKRSEIFHKAENESIKKGEMCWVKTTKGYFIMKLEKALKYTLKFKTE